MWENHREALIAIALLSLVFSIILGGVLFRIRRPVPAPIIISLITPLPTQTRTPTATPEPIRVYVSGAVVHPGVCVLPWDSRVEQAIAAAGGAAAGADLIRVNLAQRVYDEQQIYVPYTSDVATPILPTAVSHGASEVTTSSTEQRININTAAVSELETLSGIGPVLAQRIVEYRNAHGPFQKLADIKKVKGIGDSIFERIEGSITVE